MEADRQTDEQASMHSKLAGKGTDRQGDTWSLTKRQAVEMEKDQETDRHEGKHGETDKLIGEQTDSDRQRITTDR